MLIGSPEPDPVDVASPEAIVTEHEPAQTVRVDVARAEPQADAGESPPVDSLPLVGEFVRFDTGFKPGDRVVGFTILERLGAGSFAQVFLAEQDALAGRRVVLKVSPEPTPEPERLARLQHPNIVPIHSVHQYAGGELICMPFLGRHTLADVLSADHVRRASGCPTRPAGGFSTAKSKSRTQTLSRPRELAPSLPPATDQPVELPSPSVDVDWVLRLLAALAAGLDHAHRRGVLHLDIKPANVLLADSGEPMLLDFNLSHDRTQGGRRAVGGTILYMAPEQLAAMLDSTAARVDERSDLFALGVLAYELLAGAPPYPAQSMTRAQLEEYLKARRTPAPQVDRLNQNVPPALCAIVAKLLAPSPGDRYATALELQRDIERHFADLPLAAAPNPSRRELFAKWRRRNPWVPARMFGALAIGLGIALAVLHTSGARAERERASVATARAATRDLHAVRLDLSSPTDPAARARGRAAAEERLAPFGLPADADWRANSSFARLPASMKPATAAELGELLLLLAHANRADAGDPATALALVERAEACFEAGAVPPFAARLRTALEAPTDAPRAASTARDYYLDAVALIGEGKYRAGLEPLTACIAADPGHAAAHFALGFCRQQLGQYARALERYDTAHALLPGDPRPVFNRGLVYGAQKKHALAEAEFALALKLDPAHAEAYRNRAVARMRQGREKLEAAEADLTAALDRSAAPIPVYQLRAQVRKLRGNAKGAETDRRATEVYEARTEEDFLARGRAALPANPAAARAAFEAALKRSPSSLPALQNLAHVCSEYEHNDATALEFLTRAAERFPELAQVRAGRAVLLARAGKRADAHAEAERALGLSDDPFVTYQVAGAFAVSAAAHPADGERAVALLRRAIGDGFRDARTLATDPDLNPIRGRDDFKALARTANELFRD